MSSSPDPELLAATSSALTAVRAQQDERALREITSYVAGTDEPGATAAGVVMLLFTVCGELVAELGPGANPAVKLQVFDAEGEEVTIDDADPPIRTAVRTLLAQVNGDDVSAREQVDIAFSNADTAELATVLLQALRWTERLAAECAERDLPMPDWVAAALSEQGPTE